jgi:hypothetical protein
MENVNAKIIATMMYRGDLFSAMNYKILHISLNLITLLLSF